MSPTLPRPFIRIRPKDLLEHRPSSVHQTSWLYWGTAWLYGATNGLALIGPGGTPCAITSEKKDGLCFVSNSVWTPLRELGGQIVIQGSEPSWTEKLTGRRKQEIVIPFRFEESGSAVLDMSVDSGLIDQKNTRKVLPCWECGHATPIPSDESGNHFNVRHCQACTARLPVSWEELELGIPACHKCEFPTEQMYCQRCGTKQADQRQMMKYGFNIRDS